MTRSVLWMLFVALAMTAALASSFTLAQQDQASEATADEASQDEAESDPAESQDAAASSDEASDEGEDNTADDEASDSDEASEPSEAEADEDADQEGEEAEEAEEEKERKTHTLKEKPLKVQVTVDGTFVAKQMEEVKLDPEAWSSFEIQEIVDHGAQVSAGEVLVKFDDEDLNEAISDLELDLRLSELSILRAEQELPRLEQSLEMRLAEAEEAWRRTQEDYERYKEVEREQSVDTAKMNLKMAKYYLDYARDELEQLEKMYEADDLTEETEEIILQRQRTMVEVEEFSYELAKYRHDRTLNISLPRRDQDIEDSLARVKLALERARTADAVDLNRARYELEQAKVRRQRSLDRHSDLTADKSLLTLRSPAAGVVYYGSCTNGAWSDMRSMLQKLEPEKSVSKGTVLMTVIDLSDMYVLATLDEKNRPSVKQGQTVRVEPTAEGADAIEARVESVSTAPIADGKFELRVALDEELPEWLVPGMTGDAKITTYENEQALLAPKDAVHTDEMDEDARYVWLVTDDKVERREVELGKTKGDNVEITGGLQAGDVISLEDESENVEKQDDDEAEDGGDDDEE